ncbi:MucB/RseB C-terminal domain-containing protein [Pseudidiomarina taiwanensis]|uniref:Negative regulator of sigma E activity n=1 Tax=Pseudidiomarina taiwanensis TaxID=337250 RepID=A0A432ZNL5_9GAMM|nr:MucB/RseB C-terminal domain-containing protein [Pseudidiomarina taiwanensis]RUO79466.1 negative regulator of sigma E activity [Pseudidiomarina taiwanensis]
MRIKSYRQTSVVATSFILATALFSFSPASLAQNTSEPNAQIVAEQAGERWFNRMATALRELNFEANIVKAQGDRLQPLLWMHGRHDDGLEVELLMQLNGPDVRILRLGDSTSYYFQPNNNAYSLNSDVTFGLLPAAFYQTFAQLNEDYQVLLGSGARVSGRDAQFLRLVSRDNSRYHYGLWLDRDTGMLLKMQMLTPQGDVIEQLQMTSFTLRNELPVSLNDLRGVQRPPRLYDQATAAPQFAVKANWIPSGFELQRQNSRSLYETNLATDYYLYSDGLTEFSIYITPTSEQTLPELAWQGPESIVNVRYDRYAVTVVGKLPAATLTRIAESVGSKP